MKLLEIKDKSYNQYLKLLQKGAYKYRGDPPPPKYDELMASYKDPEGYTVEIRWGTRKFEDFAGLRHGRLFITNPSGEKIQAGYWMVFPEHEWNLSPDQWREMPLKKRAELEVKQQATKYHPLSQQFKFHKDRT